MTQQETVRKPGDVGGQETTGHIRGSSLMLVGRVLSMVSTFVAQVIVVRYLTKEDFGHFAYAWSVVLLLQSVLALGLDRADTRFLSLYDETRDQARFFGVLAVEALTIAATGLVVVVAVLIVAGMGDAAPAGLDPAMLSLLAVLIVLAPLQALDQATLNVFAVMARPRAIFVRRYLLEPLLRLLVIVLLVAGGRSVGFLALGYLAVGVLGTSLYGGLLVRLLRPRWVQHRLRLRQVRLPVRELFAFSLPLLTTNVVYVATTSLAAVILGYLRPSSEVAAFRAVQPVAALNAMVMLSFAILFTPAAARLWARGDHDGMRDLYWQTASWLAVLATLVLHNVLKQAGLRGTGVGVFDHRCARVYATIAGGAAAVALVQQSAHPPLPVGVAVAAAVSLLVLRLNRRALRLAGTFPELTRVPGLRRLIGE